MHPIRSVASSLWMTLGCILAVSVAAVAGTVHGFGLTAGGAMALYFVVWWITLFAVLPLGARSQSEVGEVATGTDPGAPAAPALREKALLTTLAASLVLVGAAALMPLAGL
jgi:predicted secreted protein